MILVSSLSALPALVRSGPGPAQVGAERGCAAEKADAADSNAARNPELGVHAIQHVSKQLLDEDVGGKEERDGD